MRKLIGIVFGLMTIAAGCHAQVPPNPTTFNCQNVTTFTPLNPASPATTLTYTDTSPAAGTYCYIAQSIVSSTGQVSLPSNTAGPLTVTTGKSVDLTWTAPTTGPAPTGYVISRAPAVASTLGAPALGAGSIAENESPQNLRILAIGQ